MREIKFKAKRIDNGEWVYGYLFRSTKRTIKGIELGYYIQVINNDLTHVSYEVIPETVCQFTGLKDKNGVEIYEGDLWKWDEDDGLIYEIDFAEGGFGAYTYGYYRQPGLFKYGEVIGNIHDKNKQKQALIDTMRGDEKLGLYDDNEKNHGYER